MINCPIEGCQHRSRRPDTLFVHLATNHGKHEIIKALVQKAVGEKIDR